MDFFVFVVKVFLSIYDSTLCKVKLWLLYFFFCGCEKRGQLRTYSYMYIKEKACHLSHGRQVTDMAFLRRGFFSFFWFVSLRNLSYPSVFQVSFQKIGTQEIGILLVIRAQTPILHVNASVQTSKYQQVATACI